MKKIKVGIIGTGFGAKVHAPMMKFHEGFEVVAISSVSRGNIDQVKKESLVDNVYTDWKKMLQEEDLDLVVIASAVFLHKEMVLAAYEKGLHVICEKPMALNSCETEEMLSVRNNADKFGLINHEFRFLPARTKVKELLDSGELGELLHIRYECTFASYESLTSRSRGWLGQKEAGGGMLGALGSHMIDTLQWWTSATFKEVFANLPIHVPTYTDSDGAIDVRTADDGFQVIGRLANGATVTLELVSATRQTTNTWRLEIFGTNGTLSMLDDNQVFFSYGDTKLEEVELSPVIHAPVEMPEIAARYYNGFHRMLDALKESFDSGVKHPYLADFENGHQTQLILDAIRMSSLEGKKIQL
ncbi:Gfo/Idh/MocA family protein [Bacillus sp. PS06]|uniref:Gfo/Idh/MocA family protein n=1 Tax=Bacillus sp. PS06 TaxID=2764176 RepID=UPI00177E4999|nr:Gfo/Idh/MocA family oxidoreductase [Bacillus sp. PS06]MBD8067819.1 Gfo/Idh/MocA family oxidoreductase [Bacillus sp. PS06]